jgi:hypothetical protein
MRRRPQRVHPQRRLGPGAGRLLLLLCIARLAMPISGYGAVITGHGHGDGSGGVYHDAHMPAELTALHKRCVLTHGRPTRGAPCTCHGASALNPSH